MTKCRLACLSTRKLILPPLMSLTALVTSGGDGAGLRVRHQATRAEDAGDAADLGHLIGGRDRGVEVQEAALDPLDQVVAADLVGACGLGLLGLVADGEHGDAGGLTGAVRQVDGAAHHLVGLAGVDAEPDGDLDGRVLLLRRGLLGQLRGLQRACTACRGRSSRRLRDMPCCSCSFVSPKFDELWLVGPSWPSHGMLGANGYSTVMPIDRAVPAMIFAALRRCRWR